MRFSIRRHVTVDAPRFFASVPGSVPTKYGARTFALRSKIWLKTEFTGFGNSLSVAEMVRAMGHLLKSNKFLTANSQSIEPLGPL